MANDGTTFRNQYKASTVAKAELGTKRQCPKCGTRFYDLGNDDPVTCIECEETFVPEVLLKPRRPVPVAEKIAKPGEDAANDDDATEGDDDLLDVDVDVDEDDDDEDIEGILEVEDDTIDDEISAEVVIDTDVGGDDEK